MPTPLEKYGSTPVSPAERHAFVSGFSAETKQAVDQAEIDGLEASYVKYLSGIVSGRIGAAEMTDWAILEKLHRESLSGIWQWAGQIRTTELNIGVDPVQVRQKFGEFMENLKTWLQTDWFTDHEIALKVHHEITRIHPCVDVNGRISRMYADPVMAFLTDKPVFVIDWSVADLDKPTYIAALRHADQAAGDVSRLMAILPPMVALVD